MLQVSQSLTSLTLTPVHFMTLVLTFSTLLAMGTVDAMMLSARCCGVHISGEPVLCSKLHTSCKFFCLFYVIPFMLRRFPTGRGLQYCAFQPYAPSSHSFTTRQVITLDATASHAAASSPRDNAHVEVFNKTLAFYCALVEKGCAFSSAVDFPESSDTIEQENDPPLDVEELPTNPHWHKTYKCNGRLELQYENYDQPYI